MDLLTLLLGATLTSLLNLAPFILPFLVIFLYYCLSAGFDWLRLQLSRNDANRR